MNRGIYNLLAADKQLNERYDLRDAFDDLDKINEEYYFDELNMQELIDKLRDQYKIDLKNLDLDLGFGYKLVSPPRPVKVPILCDYPANKNDKIEIGAVFNLVNKNGERSKFVIELHEDNSDIKVDADGNAELFVKDWNKVIKGTNISGFSCAYGNYTLDFNKIPKQEKLLIANKLQEFAERLFKAVIQLSYEKKQEVDAARHNGVENELVDLDIDEGFSQDGQEEINWDADELAGLEELNDEVDDAINSFNNDNLKLRYDCYDGMKLVGSVIAGNAADAYKKMLQQFPNIDTNRAQVQFVGLAESSKDNR